jgi:hypothetical protein
MIGISYPLPRIQDMGILFLPLNWNSDILRLHSVCTITISLEKKITFIKNGRRWNEIAIFIEHSHTLMGMKMVIPIVRIYIYTLTPSLFCFAFFHS